MKVKAPQTTPVDAMEMMANASNWTYYNSDLWELAEADANSPDSDSDHEEDSNPAVMPVYQGGMPADVAMAMSGLPGYGFDTIGPLSSSEKDVLDELVQELGIVSSQNPGVLPPLTQPQPAVAGMNKAPVLPPANVVNANQLQASEVPDSQPSVVLSIKDGTAERKTTTTAKSKPVRRQQPLTPNMDDILARPVKSNKPVDVDAVMERNRKNAIQARINRQKKKQQMDSLEERIAELEEDNKALEVKCATQEQEKDVLRQEIVYLRSVLANQSALAGLLKNVNHMEGATLQPSLVDRKRASDSVDSTLQEKKPKTDASGSTSGVCLHVDSDVVSLEFCEKCAQMAKRTTEASSTFSSA